MTDEIIAILDLGWWLSGGSNSYNAIIQFKKAIKRHESFDIERIAPQERTIYMIPTWDEEPHILLTFSVNIIIVIFKFITIIH